jgi:hypothetical protein
MIEAESDEMPLPAVLKPRESPVGRQAHAIQMLPPAVSTCFVHDYYRYVPADPLPRSNGSHLGEGMHRARVLYFALFLLATPLCLARDLAIVVNSTNPASTVTAAELEKLLKTEVQNWPDGRKVKVFVTDPNSADSKMILQRACNIKPEDIKSLAGAHQADIHVVGSDEIVLTMVDNNPGAIGIVNVYSINSHVKVLKVDKKLPMEPGYLLHGN